MTETTKDIEAVREALNRFHQYLCGDEADALGLANNALSALTRIEAQLARLVEMDTFTHNGSDPVSIILKSHRNCLESLDLEGRCNEADVSKLRLVRAAIDIRANEKAQLARQKPVMEAVAAANGEDIPALALLATEPTTSEEQTEALNRVIGILIALDDLRVGVDAHDAAKGEG